VSCSRSGEPRWDAVTDSSDRPSWASSVEWAKADLLKPESYKPFLTNASAVVHSMGILLEADYKGVVQGREPIVSGLQRAFSSSKLGSQNPLTRHEGESLEPKEKDGQLTYELMNRDSGMFQSNCCDLFLETRTLTHLLLAELSHRISPRILERTCPSIRIHLRRGGCTRPSSQVYHHQTRGRGHHHLHPS
jgi:hypothetical protein